MLRQPEDLLHVTVTVAVQQIRLVLTVTHIVITILYLIQTRQVIRYGVL